MFELDKAMLQISIHLKMSKRKASEEFAEISVAYKRDVFLIKVKDFRCA